MAGVYVSYPFCGQKCTFCNFASGVQPAALEAAYREALLGEVNGFVWSWRPETVYLGGGTPSNLDLEYLATLLGRIPGRPWAEATLEVAPGALTTQKLRAWREAGINRLSFGVQSFDPAELRYSGRRHSAQTVVDEVALARSEAIGNFNIDLIAGMPYQTRESWADSLDWVARLEAPHVSVYMLEVDEDSRLGREILAGGTRYGAAQAPSEELTAELYETAVERLAALGIPRYEISNFARPGFESRHNLKYWRMEPYAGFGADAHSFDGSFRRQNAEEIEKYVELCRIQGHGLVETNPNRPEEERLFLGLRLMDGVELTPEDQERHRAPIARFLAEGLLEQQGNRLRLTSRGVMLSNEVFQEFLSE